MWVEIVGDQLLAIDRGMRWLLGSALEGWSHRSVRMGTRVSPHSWIHRYVMRGRVLSNNGSLSVKTDLMRWPLFFYFLIDCLFGRKNISPKK